LAKHRSNAKREALLSKPFIVLGDSTDHGGTVVSASSTFTTMGKQIARVGDQVSCPRCRGVHVIAEGDPSMTDGGMAVAYDGCKTTCGAKLIATQMVSTTTPSGGAGTGAGSSSAGADGGISRSSSTTSLPPGYGSIGGGMAAGYQDEPVENTAQRYKGRFQVLDSDSGQPVVGGQSARIRGTGGQYVVGSTDADGFTPWVERDASERLAFDLIAS
jgi:uncharacterized Zn-binding protein involved in type VI secretion